MENILASPHQLQGRIAGLFRSPKTILGFFALMTGILGIFIFSCIRLFSDIAELRTYIVGLLVFGACAFTLIIFAILITAWIKPEKLMLGEIKGDVYLQMLKLRQGDSESGEIIEQIIAPPNTISTLQSSPSSQSKEDRND